MNTQLTIRELSRRLLPILLFVLTYSAGILGAEILPSFSTPLYQITPWW